MFLVFGVVAGDFLPKSAGMVHMVEMGEFVDDDVVAENFGDLHEADVERNCAVRRATSPPCGGVREAAFFVGVAVEFGEIFQSIRQVFLRIFHQEFLFGVSGALRSGVAQGDLFADEIAVNVEKTFDEKIAGMLWHGHLQPSRGCHRKSHVLR